MVLRHVELTEEQNETLEQLAASQGRSVSDLIRSGVATVLSERSPYVSEAVSEYDPVQRLSQRESELLLRVNRGLAAGMAERYRELMGRRRAGALAGEELRELLRLTEESERLQAERVEHLTELARLRAKPLGVLIEELGIRPSPNA